MIRENGRGVERFEKCLAGIMIIAGTRLFAALRPSVTALVPFAGPEAQTAVVLPKLPFTGFVQTKVGKVDIQGWAVGREGTTLPRSADPKLGLRVSAILPLPRWVSLATGTRALFA